MKKTTIYYIETQYTMADRISSDKANIYENYLSLAKKFINQDSEDYDNTDFLKTGLFGYVTESLAAMTRDSIMHKSLLYNESFLNTARIPKSIYNYAKLFNIEVTKAEPSYADIEIRIPKDELDNSNMSGTDLESKYGADCNFDANNEKAIVIDKSNPIIAGDYYFSLEHSILIKINTKSTPYSYQASYITTEEETTDFQGILSGNKRLVVNTSENDIIIPARVYQYKVREYTKQIVDSSFLNTKIHTFEFSDQFAGASLYYARRNGIKNPVYLKYNNISSGTDAFVNNNFLSANYSLNDEHVLQILFSNLENGFIPQSNSTLYLKIFETKGANVPSQFTGIPVMTLKEESLRNLPISVVFNPTTIVGGYNVPSLERIKETIIDEISSRDVIVTEKDLNNYFNALATKKVEINNGKLKFIKKRNDYLKREFMVYILMRDGIDRTTSRMEANTEKTYTSSCIPTNTIDIRYNNINQGTADLKFGSKIYFDKDNEEYIVDESENNSSIEYIIPFYIRVELYPYKKVKYIFNLTDSDSSLKYYDITSSIKGISPKKVSIKRDFTESSANEYYLLVFELSSEISDLNSSNFILNFFNSNSNISLQYSPPPSDVKLEQVEGSSYFDYTITYKLEVNNTEFNFGSNDYGSLIHIDGLNGGLTEDIIPELNINHKDFIGSLRSSDYLSLFRSLDSIMNSEITIYGNDNEISEISNTPIEINNIVLSDVPVISKKFFDETKTISDAKSIFIKQLFQYINILKENLAKLETNTFFNLKFYNTYGISKYYRDLDYTNLSKFEWKIDLIEAYKEDEDLKFEIRDYIRRTIDVLNDSKSFSVSDVISNLSNTYGSQISNIEFHQLDGKYQWKYDMDTTIDEKDFTPEWINIIYNYKSNEDGGPSYYIKFNNDAIQ